MAQFNRLGAFPRWLALAGTVALAAPAGAVDFQVTALVTDDPAAHAAPLTDADLVNPWGLSYGPTSPFWVSANGTGRSLIYSVVPATQATTKVGLTVSIPGTGVTGQAFNPGVGFNGDRFLFVTEDGRLAGWRGALGTAAETLALGSGGEVYKGLAFGTTALGSYAYAADFHAGSIAVFKGQPLDPDLVGNFTDPNLPAGFAPFNVQTLGAKIYVAYAKQDVSGNEEVAGAGLGIVDEFSLQGDLLARVATGGALNAPWGLAIAPSSFGELAGALLVGNFGDGRIHAYDLATHNMLGAISGAGGAPLAIDGLWALAAGNDSDAGSSALLYFTAGPDDEQRGLFGVLTPVPEPATAALWLLGLGWMAVRRRRAQP